MKKNGFTMVELLAVVIILGILSLIIVPKVIELIQDNKNKAYDRQIQKIEEAANLYVTQKNYDLVFLGNEAFLNIQTLIENGCIESPVVDPRTNNEFDLLNAGVVVKKETSSKYSFTFAESYSLGTYFVQSTYSYEVATTKLTTSSNDDGYGTLPLGFNLDFGGISYSTIYVGTNGIITFAQTDATKSWSSQQPLFGTSALTYPAIGVYFTDLIFYPTDIPTSGIYYTIGSEEGRNYVLVEYRDVINYGDDVYHLIANVANFEVKIYDDGEIIIAYADIKFQNELNESYGIGAAVGVHVSPTNSSIFLYDEKVLRDHMAITFYVNA